MAYLFAVVSSRTDSEFSITDDRLNDFMYWAVANNNISVLERVLARGADVNEIDELGQEMQR